MDKAKRGFVIVDALDEHLAFFLHTSILLTSVEPLKYEIWLSGIWEVDKNDRETIRGLLKDRVPVGTIDGLAFIESAVGIKVSSQALQNFVNACHVEQSELQKSWQEYKEAEPSKRKNLVTPKWPSWPENVSDAAPIELLGELGKLAYPADTPKDMQTMVAFGKLMYLMLENWMNIEEERIRRKFLKEKHPGARLWPPSFAESVISQN